MKPLLLFVCVLIAFHSTAQKKDKFKENIIYKSDILIIKQIAKNAFIHTSFLQTNDFGNVPCNGLFVRNNNEVVIFDTPTNDKSATELIQYLKDSLKYRINAIVPTHFHDDCLGGLNAFHKYHIPSYANTKTIELAKKNNFALPQNGFNNLLTLKVGKKEVILKFFGEGHTVDNIVGYFPSEKVLFGGCLIKTMNANKGYVGDANLDTWSNTVEKVKKEYPKVKIVVPGHGEYGNNALLDYTITLFKKQ